MVYFTSESDSHEHAFGADEHAFGADEHAFGADEHAFGAEENEFAFQAAAEEGATPYLMHVLAGAAITLVVWAMAVAVMKPAFLMKLDEKKNAVWDKKKFTMGAVLSLMVGAAAGYGYYKMAEPSS